MTCDIQPTPDGHKEVTIKFVVDKDFYKASTFHTVLENVCHLMRNRLETALLFAKQANGTLTFDCKEDDKGKVQ